MTLARAGWEAAKEWWGTGGLGYCREINESKVVTGKPEGKKWLLGVVDPQVTSVARDNIYLR